MMDEKPKDKRIVPMVSLIGSLAVLLAAITSLYSKSSIIYQNIMIILLIIITVISICGFFGQPIIEFQKNINKTRKHNILTKGNIKEFKSFVDRMGELFIYNRVDNIPHVLYELQNHGSEFRDIIPRIDELRELYNVFKRFVEKSTHNKKSFLLCIKWFESILNIYNNIFVCKPVERAQQINDEKIPKHIRINYDEQKSRSVRFIEDYSLFAKKLNSEFSENVVREYYQPPKSL